MHENDPRVRYGYQKFIGCKYAVMTGGEILNAIGCAEEEMVEGSPENQETVWNVAAGVLRTVYIFPKASSDIPLPCAYCPYYERPTRSDS